MLEDNVSHLSECVFYDVELRSFRKAFDECYKILKSIDKRASRAQTIQVSKSLFDYYDRKRDFKVCPQRYFDFRLDNIRICIYVYKGRYSILSVNVSLPYIGDEVEDYIGAGHLYFRFDHFSDIQVKFRDSVLWFVSTYMLQKDFDDREIEF